jgi:hypothetical protein
MSTPTEKDSLIVSDSLATAAEREWRIWCSRQGL